MKDALDEILKHLVRLERPVVSLLQSGVHREQLLASTRGIVNLPDEVAELYAWRNGTLIEPGAVLDRLHFFPGFYFVSLEDALDHIAHFKGDERWQDSWFPIFANGGGDFYVVGSFGGAVSPVVGFVLGESEHPIEYQSVTAMMQTIARCFQNGIFYEVDGYLEMDDLAHAECARELNPNVSFWSQDAN